MVLHPLLSEPASSADGADVGPAWPAIERAQKTLAGQYWLVAQPDHAALAGALAAHFVSPDFPAIDPLVARAIEVHDAGWAVFDDEARLAAAPRLDSRGKPLSFIEIDPPDFLRAWTASIDRAEAVCPAGGYIVSRHFCILGSGRRRSGMDTAEDCARLDGFLQHESRRQARLRAAAGADAASWEDQLLVLQFCDVLSLYLCSGLSCAVEFPQPFARGKIRIRRQNQAFLLQPSPFRSGRDTDAMLSLGVEARRYPPHPPTTTTLAFVLW